MNWQQAEKMALDALKDAERKREEYDKNLIEYLCKHMEDIDPEFSKEVDNKHFWELV